VTQFPGFDLVDRAYTTRQFVCRGCPNACRVTEVRFAEGRPFYYGAGCDRYETHGKVCSDLPDLFRRREEIIFAPEGEPDSISGVLRYPPAGPARGRVGIPRSLTTWDQFPLFREYFRALGYEVVLSPLTNPGLVRSSLLAAPATACLPVKVVHGHVEALVREGVTHLFIAAVVDAHNPHTRTKTNYHCPLVQAQPYILASQFDFAALGVEEITVPLHFYRPGQAERELAALARKLGASRGEAERALERAEVAQTEARARIRALGEEALARVAQGEVGVVVLSRPYSSCDEGLSLDVPGKLGDLGALAIPLDALPWEEVDIDTLYPFMQWHSGKRILAGAEIVRRTEGLWAVHLTHFNCGPDSFIAHYLQEALRGKPVLTLELDEHSADAGVMTRLEAYLDSISALKRKPRPAPARAHPHPREGFDRTKKIFLPYMCDASYGIMGPLRHFGYEVETLPQPDEESLALGRKHSTGGECLPFILTTGDFLKLARKEEFDPKRSCLFMATSTGPCRFCHYFASQRLILERLGYPVDFISIEAYGGYTIEDLGTAFRRTAWYGVSAVDVLQKLLWRTRPYERVAGETDAVYGQAVREIEAALAKRGIRGLLAVLPEVVARFERIAVRDEKRPRIGIVGEIYVRANPFSNGHLIHLVEALGGEARVAPVGEWLAYTQYKKQGDCRTKGEWPGYIKSRLERYVLRRDEHRVGKAFAPALPSWERQEPTIETTVGHSEPYISDAYRGEPVLTVGKAIDYAHHGFDGIINVMPFSCMPGTMVAAVSNQIKHDHGIPWLNLTFDGQEQAHLRTRLEAFLHQCEQHRRSRVT